ncbi:hypothetical protein AC249_AIPGENE18673 [Exaiptasia diaphana]|nr:hypothetical protein AC249_AIPGENE18673 [Exaiptasia diaphana]
MLHSFSVCTLGLLASLNLEKKPGRNKLTQARTSHRVPNSPVEQVSRLSPESLHKYRSKAAGVAVLTETKSEPESKTQTTEKNLHVQKHRRKKGVIPHRTGES